MTDVSMADMALSSSLAKLTAQLTGAYDLATTVQSAVGLCRLLGTSAAGVLVSSEAENLEVLASSSHHTYLLELYQALSGEGPCVDVIRGGRPVDVTGARALADRWPATGEAIVGAGYLGVLAVPMTWRDTTFGGLNLFFSGDDPIPGAVASAARSVADLISIAVAHADDGTEIEGVRSVLQRSLAARSVVERAKGVVAEQESVTMHEAFTRLVESANDSGHPLPATAQDAIDHAARGDRWNRGRRSWQSV